MTNLETAPLLEPGAGPAPSLASPCSADFALLRLRLARTPGVGARTARLLEERVGSLEALFAFSAAELEAAGVPARLASGLADRGPLAAARAERARLGELGAGLLALGDPAYPSALAEIHDPPQTLSLLGALTGEDARCVAIVGARRATPVGLEVAFELAAGLADAGYTIVSGLARGIDAAAHRGALEAGGRTLAVLAGGLARVYPPRHRDLARQVARSGALLSEAPPDQEPTRFSFPQRNRIVAGLAQAVVVVEAGPRSGALITAELALQEGRELFAVPGSPRAPLAQGTNNLIQDGARLVTCPEDVLEALGGVAHRPVHPSGAADADPAAAALRRALAEANRPLSPEALAASTGLPLARVQLALARLELEGAVERRAWGYGLAGSEAPADMRA